MVICCSSCAKHHLHTQVAIVKRGNQTSALCIPHIVKNVARQEESLNTIVITLIRKLVQETS